MVLASLRHVSPLQLISSAAILNLVLLYAHGNTHSLRLGVGVVHPTKISKKQSDMVKIASLFICGIIVVLKRAIVNTLNWMNP